MRKNLLLTLLFIPFLLSAQKAPLDNNAYDGWKSLSSPMISEDGKWVTYTINPQQGDGWLYIYNVATAKKDSAARGRSAVFAADSRYLAYQVIPSYAATRQAKKNKLKDDKLPKNNLEIRLLSNNEVIVIPRVKSFSVPENNSYWMAYLLEKKSADVKKIPSDTLKVTVASTRKKAKVADPKGTELVIYNPVLKKEYRYSDVTEYIVSKDGKSISYLQSIPDTTKFETLKVNVFETQKEISTLLFEAKGSVKKLNNDRVGNSISFMYSSDTAKVKVYDLWLARNLEKAVKVVDQISPGMPKSWSVSENGTISFSDDGTRIYFGTAKKPVAEPVDTLLEEEKYKLDIWSWDDNVLQPMQKRDLDQENKRTWMAVYHLNTGKMFQLADSVIPSVRTMQKGDGQIALGYFLMGRRIRCRLLLNKCQQWS